MNTMREALPAIVKTLIFTVVVPGTVAGYVPWRFRQDAVAPPATGAEAWAAITVIAIGMAIYRHPALWVFARPGGGPPARIAPPKILVVEGLHRFVPTPMSLGVAHET